MKNTTAIEALTKEFENVLADINSLLQTTSDISSDELQEVREKIQARILKAKESVTGIYIDLARRAQVSASRVDLGVHEEPWKAIGVSAAVGLLLGLVLTRK